MTSLGPGATTTCTATGIAIAVEYENTATVTGTDPFGTQVTDADPSHYSGQNPGIDVEKSTNGVDADVAPGPYIEVGGAVTWEYVVTNTGNVVIDEIILTDDVLGAISCPNSVPIRSLTSQWSTSRRRRFRRC